MGEVLLFSLGSERTYGIAASTVREVVPMPPITPVPRLPAGIEGFVLMHGRLLPVLALARFIEGENAGGATGRILIVSECAGRALGLRVCLVERLIALDAAPAPSKGEDRCIFLLDIATLQAMVSLDGVPPDRSAVAVRRDITVCLADGASDLNAARNAYAPAHMTGNEAWPTQI